MQARNGVSQPIQGAVESRGIVTDGLEALTAIPRTGSAGIDIGTEHIVTRPVAVDPLQISTADGTLRTQAGEDGVVDDGTAAAQLGTEAAATGQVDRRVDVVGRGGAADHATGRTLAVLQRQPGRIRAVHGGVDVDVAIGVQRERVGAPADRVVDMDIAVAAAAGTADGTRARCIDVGGLDGDVAATQRGAQRRASDVATAGRNGEVEGVNQPGAVLAAGSLAGNRCAIDDIEMRTGSLDKSAIAAVRRRCIQRAGDLHGA